MLPREFAIQVVQNLQQAGFQAWWAGGCVRDQLLGITPKDYDVATSANPDQIRQLFGKKRTLPIGAAFGVITVLGPKSAGQIEVATFRRDAEYSDGRRPDAVEFTDAQEDALRRDFTINGMFFDPVAGTVIDFVNGQEDLTAGLIRAIGDPHQRISEDKLRMLRAVRFASTYGFQLESDTLAAVRQHASEIQIVSEERIGAELIRMLAHANKSIAAKLLYESVLLTEVLPKGWRTQTNNEPWRQRFEELANARSSNFESAIAILLRDFLKNENQASRLSQLQSAWRLTNRQRESIGWIVNHWKVLSTAEQKRWSEIQPLLIHSNANEALDVAKAILSETDGIKYCRERLQWPTERLNPAPLLVGKDLIDIDLKPSPTFKSLLQTVRNKQLDGELHSQKEAIEFIQSGKSK